MHRWLNHSIVRTRALPLQRRRGSAAAGIALISVLGMLPGCLNPDISEETPLTTQAPALDLEFDEGSGLPDEQAEPNAPVEEGDEDEDEPDAVAPDSPARDRSFRNPRRRTTGRR